MKQKKIGISLILLICSVLFAWYAIGAALHLGADFKDIVLPVNGTITNNNTIIFNCTSSQNGTVAIYNMTLWLTKSGGTMAYNRTNITALSVMDSGGNVSTIFDQVELEDGIWFWNCLAWNGSNTSEGRINVSAQDYTVMVDTTAPVITFTGPTPANDSYIIGRDSNVNNSLNIDVAITELYPANITFNISMLNGTGYTWNYTTSTTGVGTLNLTMVSMIMPFNNTNGSSPPDDNTTFMDATLYIIVDVSDNASNKGTARRTITTDSINPWINITYPGTTNNNETIFKANGTSVAVRFNLSQKDTNLYDYATYGHNTTYWIVGENGNTLVGNTSFTPNSTITFSLNATNQHGMNHAVYFLTRDKAGREIENHTAITIDLAPVISLSYPAHRTWATTGTSHLFNFTAINNDTNVSSLDSCILYGNLVGANSSYVANKTINSSISTEVVPSMGSYNGTTVPINISLTLLEGNYTWAIKCNDTTGNSAYTANRTFYVDTINPTPTLTVTESTGTTIAIGSTVNLACTATDTLDPAPSAAIYDLTRPDSTVVSSPGASYSNIDQTGAYSVKCSSTDASGRSTIVTASFTAEYASQGGTSNGGATTGVTKTQTVKIPGILPGSPNMVKLSDPKEYGLNQIEIDVVKEVSDVEISVSKMNSKPTTATTEAAKSADRVYKYIEVKKTNIEESDIKKATMSFQVEKSWIKALGADKEQIILKRLSGTEWEKLTTTITDEDDDNIYYKANAPGLSYFAIALEEKPSVSTEEEFKEAEAEMEKAAEAEALGEVEPVKASKKWLWIGVVAVLMVIAAGIGYTLYFKKKKK
ncbi:MAG: PGF-pre-PGF domain-containing protein [archaeon]